MKNLKSPPSNHEFFSAYIGLVKSLNIAGYLGQIISALTEIGGIFTGALIALKPIIPAPYSYYASGLIAILGTAILEIGLRKSLPKTVDAILYRRFKGLHLAVTIFTFVICLLLLSASGFLSFSNSRTIVADMTKGKYEAQAATADSLKNAVIDSIKAEYTTKRKEINRKATERQEQKAKAQLAALAVAQREYSNIIRRENQEGANYRTLKDAARLKVDKARLDIENATLEVTEQKDKELANLDEKEREDLKEAAASFAGISGKIEGEQAETVSKYGGGLAYFTIICLILLVVSIILNQIVAKGAGIKENVQLSQYDINPHWFEMASEAIKDRFNYMVQSRITSFANRTPPPPLPEKLSELYDPTQLANVLAKLKAEEGNEEEYTVERKRRAIGFGKGDVQDIQNGLPFYELNRRYKDYRKRVSRHEQKALKYTRKGEAVPPRTSEAIKNNVHWRDYYKELVDNYKS